MFSYWLVVYLPLWKIWVRQLGLFFTTEWKKMFQTTNQAMISTVSFHFANGEVTMGIRRLCIQHTSTKVRRKKWSETLKNHSRTWLPSESAIINLYWPFTLRFTMVYPLWGTSSECQRYVCWFAATKFMDFIAITNLAGTNHRRFFEKGKNPIRIQWNSRDNGNMWDIIWWYWGDIVDILWTGYMSGEIVCSQHSATNLRITNISKPGCWFQPLWKLLQ